MGRRGSIMSARPRHPLHALVAPLVACALASPPARAQGVDPDDVPAKTAAPPTPPATPDRAPRPRPPAASPFVAPDDVPEKRAPTPPPAPAGPVPQWNDREAAPRDPRTIWVPVDPRYLPPGWDPNDLPPILPGPGWPTPPPRRRTGLPLDDPRRTPDRYKLLVGGALTLGGTYLATATFGAFVGKEPFFAVPLVGPLFWAGGIDEAAAYGIASLITGAQAAGLIITIVGLVQARGGEPTPRRTTISWNLAPLAGPGLAGIGAVGSF